MATNNQDFEDVPCLLCGNTNLKQLSTVGQHGLPCYVSICPNDGLVFLSPRWKKERYMHFYAKEYDSYYRPQVLSNESDQRYNIIRQICSRLENKELLKNKTSVFDIGSGMGWSLDWLKKNYPAFAHFYAIEPSENCIRNLHSIGASVVSTDVDSDWSVENVDLVIMRHVLEHFMNPVEVLKKVHNSLAEGGVVYIAVPDMMNPKKSLTGHCFRSVHTYYFANETLTRIAGMAGLVPVVLESSEKELWGIFRKRRAGDPGDANVNNYKKQIEVIEKHRNRSRVIDLKTKAKRILKKIIGK